MPWTDVGGFSAATPWLPYSAQNLDLSVGRQESDPSSALSTARQLLALRQSSAALRHGTLENLVCDGGILSFDRIAERKVVRCIFNLGDKTQMPASLPQAEVLFSVNAGSSAELPAFSGAYFALAYQ
jgi:alpha-glucosidase